MELRHHGILGMHWGVRRYQPYPKGHAGGREIGEAAKKAANGRMHADKKSQEYINDYRESIYRQLGGTKKLNRQKMSTYSQSNNPYEDYVVKKGGRIQHITIAKNTKIGSIRNRPQLYVSTNEADNKNYAGFYGAMRMTSDPRIKKLYKMNFEAAQDLVSPSKVKRVENFLELYYDNPASVSRDIAKFQRSYGLSYESPKKIVKRYMNMSLDELSTEGYQAFADSWAMVNHKSRDQYWNRLKEKGYNAIIDDHDVHSDVSPNQSRTPLIVFNALNSLSQVSVKELTRQDVLRNIEEWVEMEHSAMLKHHGILGQKWGKRNGPPYPLGASNHSASEKKAGWRKSLDKPSKNGYSTSGSAKSGFHLSDGQKRALKVGAVIAVAALASYGAQRIDSRTLSNFKMRGQQTIHSVMHEIGSKSVSSFTASGNFTPPSPPKPPNQSQNQQQQSASKPKRAPIIRDPKTNFKLIKESVEDSLRNANPLRGSSDGDNNCTYSAVAGFLRTQGYDVMAKSTGGKMQNLAGVLEDCFKGVKVREGSATKFAKSPDDAAEMLKKRFGDNASGAVGITFKNTGGRGHTFSWTIKDGVVKFLDFQQGSGNDSVKAYWRYMDPNGGLTFAQLDGLEINLDNIDKYVSGR